MIAGIYLELDIYSHFKFLDRNRFFTISSRCTENNGHVPNILKQSNHRSGIFNRDTPLFHYSS